MSADAHDLIRIQGARENNLRDLTLDIPKRRLTVFTGVSGSGKSSLVFDTIAAESQRLINETYTAFLQGMMPSQSRPEVDRLQGLTTAITVDQSRLGANPRSTVGTVTDVDAMLRVLFSRLAEPHIGGPKAFSFNVASVSGAGALTVQTGDRKGLKQRKEFHVTGGMCPRCEGRGSVSDIDLSQLYDDSRSLDQGALTIPGYKPGSWNVRFFTESGFLDPDKPIADYSRRELNDFLYKEPTKVKFQGINMTYEGLIPRIRRSMLAKSPEAMQPHIRAFVDRAVAFARCPECQGTRLSEGARSATIGGRSIADLSAIQVSDLAEWVRCLDEPSAAPLLDSLAEALDAFSAIGLDYLSLNRPSGTLSGGEAQRVKMIRHLGSALTDVTYVFDEPTAGLHPADIDRLNGLLTQLRDKSNTVLVVEHKPETIAIADHIVDLGPGAGPEGGTICYQGDVEGLRTCGTLTGRHLSTPVALKESVRTATGTIPVRHANLHNLRDVSVDIPLGVLCAVTGVAGSGKSSLIGGCLPTGAGAITIDQTPIKGSRRSNPATYTGLLDPIRKAFATANGVKPALFSSNSQGACPTCNGNGVVYTEFGFMQTTSAVCEDCGGKRYQPGVLEYRLAGRDISQVLDMTVEQAHEFFSSPDSTVRQADRILSRMRDVGLNYLTIGQPLSTLSGGELQRLKLAIQMAQDGGLYVLDEPTSGLHPADIDILLRLLDQLVDAGRSVIVIEHHLTVIAHADWVIDLGPGAGHNGGLIDFTGTPRELAAGDTVTGQYLARRLG
ncbi:excinuclease ABC subunit UvrA [Acidipropionibacterium jensenii]|uniref:ATP-binding cassette domain-containing protein n=1 Tax=Acidipropionibacterium jensenii TaxID=1749 RepID=UPI00110BF28C|nr:excinuclease ABC subunit UvrA [Acidipropionibacterium jensenii]QCV88471.1 excinuclease ABC subunit UvrA [Acidipropionibacterium jensenii]